MSTRRLSILVVVALLAVLPVSASGSVLPLTERQLVAGSAHVVVAVVEDARSRWNPQGTLIVTDYTLRVEESLRGEASGRMTISIPGGTLGGETHETSLSTPLEPGVRYLLCLEDLESASFLPITGGWQGAFREIEGAEGAFSDRIARMREVTERVEREPEAADTDWLLRGEDRDLPAKAWDPRGAKFVVRDPAVPPIVFNPLPGNIRFSPHDQRQMAYWNLYAGDLFRVSPNPSPSWAFGNGVFEIAGFPTSAQMQQQFDRAWSPGAFSMVSCRTQSGHVVECDIALNPAFSWTLDDEASTAPNGPRSFRDAILKGLGTSWGYRGQIDLLGGINLTPVTRDSVMNVRAPAHSLATLFAEDAQALRATFAGRPLRDGVISAYSTRPFPFSPRYEPVRASMAAVRAGGGFDLLGPVKIENPGTEDLANPAVEVYLVKKRFSLNRAILVKTVRPDAKIAPGEALEVALGRVVLPRTVPRGTYYLAFVLKDPADAYQANNRAWSTAEVKIRVTR